MVAYARDGKSEPIVQLVKTRLEDGRRRFQELHESIGADLRFGLDMQHYDEEPSLGEMALDRIKPRDPGLFRVWRYKKALLLKRFPVNVDTRPEQAGVTSEEVADMKRAIERVLHDPKRWYKRVRDDLVGGSLAAKMWGVQVCYHPNLGIYFKSRDPRTVVWADGFKHPNDPMCPWVAYWDRIPISQAKAMPGWRIPSDLQPDDGYGPTGGDADPQNDDAQPAMLEGDEKSLVTVVFYYCRFEKPKRDAAEKPKELSPDMWHLACANCGWKSPPQAEAMSPYGDVEPCPACGNPAGLVTAAPSDGIAYTGGKRLVICFPFSNSSTPAYDGDWEFDYPHFPVDLLVAYPVPHKPASQSDTSALKTPTSAKNAMIRLAYETMLRSKPKWMVPRDGLYNVYGMPYTFAHDDGDFIQYDGLSYRDSVQLVQGQGVNPGVFTLMQMLDSVFRVNESTSELALSPSQVKEAKVGTVEMVTETGNVILDYHGDLLYEVETRVFSNVAAAIRGLPSEDTRYQDETGEWNFKPIGGPSMPKVEVIVSAGTTLDMLDKDEIEAFGTLASLPPALIPVYAEIAHIDPVLAAKVQQAMMMQQQMMAAAQGAGAPGPAPPQPQGAA